MIQDSSAVKAVVEEVHQSLSIHSLAYLEYLSTHHLHLTLFTSYIFNFYVRLSFFFSNSSFIRICRVNESSVLRYARSSAHVRVLQRREMWVGESP